MRTIRFTRQGYEKLLKEQDSLRKERVLILADLKRAREMGDLKENGLYQATRFKLTFLDRRLRIIGYTLKDAIIVELKEKDSVTIGSTVTISDGTKEITYTIVGDLEADPKQHKISLLSPIGKALHRKKVGDKVEVNLPSRKAMYTVLRM